MFSGLKTRIRSLFSIQGIDMTSVMQNLAYASSFVSFLLTCHLWIVRPALRAGSVILGAYFLVLSLQLALLSLTLEFGRDHWWMFIRPTLAMTIGPVAWIYFSSAASADFKIGPRHALHLLPALFIAFEMLAGIYIVDIDLAIIVSFGAYAAAIGWRARLGRAQFSHLGAHASGQVYRWLVVTAALLALSLVGEMAIVADIQRGREIAQSPALLASLILTLFLVGFILLATLRRPSLFDWMYEIGNAAFAAKLSSYSEVEYKNCIARLEALVAHEKLYAEDGVTVRVAAKKLGVPARLLSEAVNRIYGESYSRHMNRLRVDAARRLLYENAGISITEVMLDAGFRTKSSFNKEFRAFTGESPSAFRQRVRLDGV